MREDKTEKTKISRLLGRSRANDRKILTKTKLQPHGLIVTSLLHRMFAERIAFFAVTLCLGLSLFWQAVQNIDLRSKLDKKSMYLVPSAISEVIRVRPDMVAPKAVYNFAENIIHKLTNVNFEDADVRYKELSTYMHPELKGRFMREMRPIVEYWKQMKVDQHFSYETPTEFKRTTEIVRGSKKSVFRVEVWGRTKKYIEGRSTIPYRERISLAFITKQFSADDPWVFRLIDIKRETEQQIQDERIKMANKKGGKS